MSLTSLRKRQDLRFLLLLPESLAVILTGQNRHSQTSNVGSIETDKNCTEYAILGNIGNKEMFLLREERKKIQKFKYFVKGFS